MDSKIKQTKTIPIGQNIRNLRQAKGIGQTELVRLLQLRGIDITRESLVKIERGIQHIYASQEVVHVCEFSCATSIFFDNITFLWYYYS